jgi:hypothetical protein
MITKKQHDVKHWAYNGAGICIGACSQEHVHDVDSVVAACLVERGAKVLPLGNGLRGVPLQLNQQWRQPQ